MQGIPRISSGARESKQRNPNRGAGETARASRGNPPERSPAPVIPFTLLISDEKYAALDEQAKVETYAMLRDQFRRLLRLSRLRGLDPSEVREALWP